jgi:beta-ketodecanoyl-[acyl-carrier-protein] synthase
MGNEVIIKSTGFYLPDESISNEELVESFNGYVSNENCKIPQLIRSGEEHQFHNIEKMDTSNSDFIVKASGIRKRQVINKAGILDKGRMKPYFRKRSPEEISIQAEFALKSACIALNRANKSPSELDGIIVACSNFQRPYPAISIEVQHYLGASGWAFDMNAACSSAAFGMINAYNHILSGMANSLLVICPEIYTGHLNYRDRRSHFIFGDASAAALIESYQASSCNDGFKIISVSLDTKFSNNIRNNFGFLSPCDSDNEITSDHYFVQNGKKVREEVVPMAIEHIKAHLKKAGIENDQLSRMWLHQANKHMNEAIAKAVKGTVCNDENIAPLILDEYGNTGASGSLISFDKFSEDLGTGDIGIFCAFGAGYTIGSLLLKKT